MVYSLWDDNEWYSDHYWIRGSFILRDNSDSGVVQRYRYGNNMWLCKRIAIKLELEWIQIGYQMLLSIKTFIFVKIFEIAYELVLIFKTKNIVNLDWK